MHSVVRVSHSCDAAGPAETVSHRQGLYLPGFRTAAGNPVLLEEVLVRHPKLRLCVDNAGYPYRGEMIAMMFQYPQLHADVSRIS